MRNHEHPFTSQLLGEGSRSSGAPGRSMLLSPLMASAMFEICTLLGAASLARTRAGRAKQCRTIRDPNWFMGSGRWCLMCESVLATQKNFNAYHPVPPAKPIIFPEKMPSEAKGKFEISGDVCGVQYCRNSFALEINHATT